MPTLPKYLDFDIAVQRSGEQLHVRILNSPGGQADAAFVLPFNNDKLENLILRMGHIRAKTRGGGSKQMQAAKELGGGLFHALLPESVARCWEKSLTVAAERRMGLRVRLRLNEAPELADLPWEYLYDDSPLNRFYHLSKETPLVRYLELPDPPGALTVTPPLNILLIISSPLDDEYVALDVAREERLLREALTELEQRGLVTVTRLSKPTLNALQRELRNRDYHILHFIGHGEFDPVRGRGYLIWEDDQRASVRVDGELFARLIEDHGTLRLVLLNACEGARPTLTDPFGGFAQRIIQQGIPAVIAMQFEITDDAAITFAREFYAALADSYPVEAALAEARKAIYALPNETEWGTPVLYSRAPEGVIFDVQSAPQLPVRPEKVVRDSFDDLYRQARSAQREAEQILEENPKDTASANEKYRQAQALFERAGELAPDDPRVAFRLGEMLVQLEPQDPKRASEHFRRAERLLTDPSTDDEKKLLANIIFARGMLSDPPNENLLKRAGELGDEVNDESLLGRIGEAFRKTGNWGTGDGYSGSTQATNQVESPPFAYPNPNAPAPPPYAVDPYDVTNPNWQPPGAEDFNPVGRWNVQVQDMVGSRLFVEFAADGMFQMMQQVGLYQVPVNGSWSYNPLTRQLGLQGVVNTFQPFTLAITINNALPNGYAAVGSDGIGYLLMRA